MRYRSDLAIENTCVEGEERLKGVTKLCRSTDKTVTTEIIIEHEDAARLVGQPCGRYITVELSEFSNDAELFDERFEEITSALRSLLPDGEGTVLAVGLGNESITPDALGPLCIDSVFSTRHLTEELLKQAGLEKLQSVCALATGVLGQTGMETGEIIKSVASFLKPKAVIAVDALACASLDRLGRTVQLTDTGITPGSGVGNSRTGLTSETLGVPVIAVGVPTVVDAVTIAREVSGSEPDRDEANEISAMMVTPRDIDLLIHRAARLLALSINSALQPSVDPELLLSLV